MSNKKEIIIKKLEITDAGAEGICIGRYDNTVVFVPYVVPGDVVDVIARKHHSFYRANVERFLSYSKDRIKPKCPHFGECGGCYWQNMIYEKQLYYKQKQVFDHFNRIGKFPFPEISPILASDNIFDYRNKVEYTFSDRKWLKKEELDNVDNLELKGCGFHLPGMFDKVLDIDYCYLHSELGNRIRNTVRKFGIEHNYSFRNARKQEGLLRNMILRRSTQGDYMLIMVFAEWNDKSENMMKFIKDSFPDISSLMYVINDKVNDSISDLKVQLYAGRDYMMEKMRNLQFKVSPLAFYQTNAAQALKLYTKVEELSDIKKDEIIYDLYTGTGTIAMFVSHHAKKTVGIEYIESAVENARENAKINKIDNVEFVAGDISKIFTDDFILKHGSPNVIITDPPRAGMHPGVVAQILKIKAEKIVYVSCNSATQARDISLLSQDYDVKAVQPVDMFPHTQHVENIALLLRK